MSQDGPQQPAGPDGHDEPDEPPGRLRPTSAAALTACAVAGLVLGWAIHPVMVRLTDRAPLVSWTQVLGLVLVAGIMGFLAWQTWQTVQVRHERLEPQQAVNRLVLARACALGGALVAAGYLGYAVSWLGDASRYSDRWILRSALAALAAGGVSVASLVLERACRTDGGRTQP